LFSPSQKTKPVPLCPRTLYSTVTPLASVPLAAGSFSAVMVFLFVSLVIAIAARHPLYDQPL
jgi:hypothetical protein